MRRWLWVILGLSAPIMAANIKGMVTSADGRKLTRARVILLHDLVAPLTQRTTTDFNGLYKLQLDPGPYRLLILKRGFRPEMKRILVLSERESLDFVHVMEISEDQGNNAQEDRSKDMLKTMLRRNQQRDHLRSVVMNVAALAPEPETPSGPLMGALSTSSHQRLDGEIAKHAEVALQTQITDGLSLRSSLRQEIASTESQETRQLKAELEMAVDNVGFNLGGESLSGLGEDFSHLGHVSAHFGEDIRSTSQIRFLQSQVEGVDQDEYDISQNLHYQLGDHVLRHEAEYRGWQHLDRIFAERFTASSSWRPAFAPQLSTSLEYQDFQLSESHFDMSRMWLGWQGALNSMFELESQVGYLMGQHDDEIVHNHQLTARRDGWYIAASYRQNQAFQSYAQHDIYGIYAQQSLTPYMTEAFYLNDETRLTLDMGIEHAYSLHSGFIAERLDERVDRLYAHQAEVYSLFANHRQDRFVYLLTSRNWGASVELGLVNHSQGSNAFRQEQVALKQKLNPFRNKALGMQLELRVQRRPEMPGWWLLQEVPTELETEGRWYEGRLGVQF